MKILLVTGNKNKQKEWQRLLPDDFDLEIVDIDLDEIQSLDMAEIVSHKVKQAYEKLGKPVVVEDIYAGIDRLNGLPGPFIKFFNQALGEGSLRELASNDGEPVTVGCVVAYYDGKNTITVRGEVKGSVVGIRGENGFGFDKVFVPAGQNKTYAEMTAEEKDTLSHRSKAVKKFVARMLQQN